MTHTGRETFSNPTARSPLCNKRYILQETPFLNNLRLALEQALDRPVTYHSRLRHLLMVTCLEHIALPITLVSKKYCFCEFIYYSFC